MSKIYTKDGKEVILIPFPEEKYNRFLAEVGETDEKKLSPFALTNMMLAIIRDFKNGSVSLDELSEMFSNLWQSVFHSYSFEEQNELSAIDDVLLAGAELNWEVRHITSSDEGDFTKYLIKVMHFYDKKATVQANVDEREKQGK